jgi:hypothetical protein
MVRKTKKGYFVPRNPQKYLGNLKNIIYRSSWEENMCVFLDGNPNILRWGSEEVVVPYVKPTDGKVHKYYIDFLVQYKNKTGKVITELFEVKPQKYTQPPRAVGKNKKTQLYEQVTYAINIAKWKAASLYATQKGWKFRIVTERDMFK